MSYVRVGRPGLGAVMEGGCNLAPFTPEAKDCYIQYILKTNKVNDVASMKVVLSRVPAGDLRSFASSLKAAYKHPSWIPIVDKAVDAVEKGRSASVQVAATSAASMTPAQQAAATGDRYTGMTSVSVREGGKGLATGTRDAGGAMTWAAYQEPNKGVWGVMDELAKQQAASQQATNQQGGGATSGGGAPGVDPRTQLAPNTSTAGFGGSSWWIVAGGAAALGLVLILRKKRTPSAP